MSSFDPDTGYDRTDPKHPGYHGLMSDRADEARKRAREERGNVRLQADIAQQQRETDETSVRNGGDLITRLRFLAENYGDDGADYAEAADALKAARREAARYKQALSLVRLGSLLDVRREAFSPEIGSRYTESIRLNIARECAKLEQIIDVALAEPAAMTDAERLAEPFAAGLLDATHILESSSE